MGNSDSKEEKKILKPSELSTYIMIVQAKLNQQRNKKIQDIKKRNEEAVAYLNEQNIEIAKLKMEGVLRNEDNIKAYDILGVICELLKEKVTYIMSFTTCPEDIRSSLESLVYASTRIEIEEFHLFREAIGQLYGEQFIIESNLNSSQLVNPNIVKYLSILPYDSKFVIQRLKLLAQEKNVNVNFPEEIEAPITDMSNPFNINQAPVSDFPVFNQPNNIGGYPSMDDFPTKK